jgi:Fe-S-cluster containining protein
VASNPHRVEVYPGREAVVEFDPERTFECVDSCSWCCQHGVMLYDADIRRLAEHAPLAETTTTFRGADFVQKENKDRTEHVGDDGAACTFLTADGTCALQAEHDWKPTRCSVFPLAVRREDGDIRVDVRDSAETHCEGMDVSERRLIDNLDAFLPALLWELDEPATDREL